LDDLDGLGDLEAAFTGWATTRRGRHLDDNLGGWTTALSDLVDLGGDGSATTGRRPGPLQPDDL
jgi:hypothetical protein